MEAETTHNQLALIAQLTEAREKLDAVSRDLHAVDDELAQLATERKQHSLLLEMCDKLQELNSIGGAALFWGDQVGVDASEVHIRRVRGLVEVFDRQVREIEERRHGIVEELKRQQGTTESLEDDLFEAQEEEERRQQEWIIEREISQLPARQVRMPWTRGGEDDKRFRKSLLSALALCLLFAFIAPYIKIPLLSLTPEEQVPERVVRLMMKARQQPPLPPREAKKPEPQAKPTEQKPTEAVQQKPVPSNQQNPQNERDQPSEEPQGILAFREKFAALKEDTTVARLGAKARIDNADNSANRAERAMLTSNAPGSSGGINLAALSRSVGGGGGNGMARVQVARATSALNNIGSPGGARPLSDSPGPSRTDEEIQIVFDRYKSALYRLYNKELRKDPTLRGQMVLHLTIEPDGSVSMCELQSSDMKAPELAAQVVERVKSINFGAKEGVSAVTILYPIDFLPAA